MIHPLARSTLRALSFPQPYSTYRSGWTERIYTNPWGGEFREYPCPAPAALAARYAWWLATDLARRDQQSEIDPACVMFTAGSIAGIDLLIRAFCEPRTDAICVQSPTFMPFIQNARAHDASVIDCPLEGSDLDLLNLDGIVGSAAKLVFICRPNNPVGTAPSLSQVVETARRMRGLVVVDEAYMEFSDLPSAIAAISDLPNLVVLRTFSKAWGLAGVRAGAVLAHPEVLNTLRLLADPFAFNAGAQRAVEHALSLPGRMLASVESIREQRAALAREITSLGYRVLPSETNFLFVLPARPLQLPLSSALVAPSTVPGALRVAVGTPEDDRCAVALLAELLSQPK